MKLLKRAAVFLPFFLICFNVIAEEISIPVMVGTTGASVNFGKPELDAYTLAVEEWNARGGLHAQRISLKVEDTQTSQKDIITAFHRLALDKPAVILGPTWLDGFPAVIPIARRKKILLITPSAAREAFTDEDRDWPITFYHNSTIEAQVLAEGLQRRGFKRIALIYEEEPFSDMIRELLLKHLKGTVADIGVQAGEDDFRPVLTRLRKQKPDLLIVFVWNENSLLALLKQLRVLLPKLPLATVHDGEGWLESPVFSKVLPRLTYSKFVVADSTFNIRFKKRFGYEPMITASNAYDAMNSLLSALNAKKTTAGEIRKYLMGEYLDTVTFGRFKFQTDGNVPSRVVVVDHLSEELLVK